MRGSAVHHRFITAARLEWAWVEQLGLKRSLLITRHGPAIQKILAGRPELMAKLLP
jgi:hypothetical protein